MRILARATRFTTVMAFLVSLSACVTDVDRVNMNFTPNDTEGLVYGRMEMLINDGAVEPSRYGRVEGFLRKFTGTDDLHRPGLVEPPGTLRIVAWASKGGDFVAKLPVGRYYFDYFYYAGAPTGFTDWVTYSDANSTTVKTPLLVTFEVLPNRATYFGTLRHRIWIDGPCPYCGGNHVHFGLDTKNEFDSATPRILSQYTRSQQPPEVQLARIQVLTTPVFKLPDGPAVKSN